ncbi:MAG TPA: NAD-binding protein [Planctomycetota bacterium]|nr:NAD-binding protein [Planctomycetota bacterium]
MTFPPVAKIVRFGLYLLREFRWPLVVFTGIMMVGGGLFSRSLGMPFSKACFTVFMLMLAQSTLDFPTQWYDQLLFFLLPVVGLGAVANSVVRLGYLVFTSKRKLQEWWIMEASAYRNHVVLCGLGRVGYSIARELLAIREPVVVIERNREGVFVEAMQDAGVPVLFGEIRLKKNLELANIAAARAIICATDDDLANLDAALTAQDITPGIRVAMRMFDDMLANRVARTSKMTVISSAQASAPAFVAAATGRSVLQSFQLDGQTIQIADQTVDRLASRTIPAVQKEFDVTVVLHKSSGTADLSPHHDRPLQKGDIIVVVAPQAKIQKVEAANRA